ncbi:MAG: tRNA glutamyl-Q(34) synthetase GluQRS [Gammaproteobacteria bacterium]
MQYVGRFAPSPTGPLHIGSLTAAVASYLHARRSDGEWLVRIEDIDPPREMPGATGMILEALDAFDLSWDRDVFYQSQHLEDYQRVAAELLAEGHAYRCSCSRRDIRGEGSAGPLGYRYPGYCRTRKHHERATAIRVRSDRSAGSFDDGLQGPNQYDIHASVGDYVIFRSDGLPAYHLAVVLDDAKQGITHVVRGMDLLHTTGLHIHLQQTLGLPSPQYLHLPIIVNAAGQKLSKRTGARPIEPKDTAARAHEVLMYLGLKPPHSMHGARPRELWAWACEHWQPNALQGQTELVENTWLIRRK